MNFILEVVIYILVVLMIGIGLSMSVKNFSKSPIDKEECVIKKGKGVGVVGLLFMITGIIIMIVHVIIMKKNRL